jgi:sulfur carrier protein ThiS
MCSENSDLTIMNDRIKTTATLVLRKECFEVPAGMTIREAIIHCRLSPEAVLAVKDGELVTDDVRLKPGDHIRLVATISGG